jgi:microcystin-dependent protein
MFSMINRGRLEQPVQEEFEHLFAKLRGFFSQSFDEDGQLRVADPNFAIVPIGGITAFAGQAAPSGYLFCDGAQVSRETYKQLFDVIGTRYGAGNGTTTFALPDLRERFAKGGTTLGATGGALEVAVPGHSHPFTAPAPTITLTLNQPPPHSHAFSAAVASSGGTDTQGFHSHQVDNHAHSIGSHAHDFGGTTDFDNAGYVNVHTDGTANIGVPLTPHQHTYSGTTAAGGNGSTGDTQPGTTGGGSHAHGVSVSGTAAGTTSAADTTVSGSASATPISGTTDPASGATVPTVPPFVTVQYLIYAGVFDEAALRRQQQARL